MDTESSHDSTQPTDTAQIDAASLATPEAEHAGTMPESQADTSEPNIAPEQHEQHKHDKPAKKRFSIQALLHAHKYRMLSIIVTAVVVLAGGVTAAVIIHSHAGVALPKSKFAAVVLPFQVTGTSPADGATGVVNVNTVTVTFNRSVDPSKLSGDFFTSPAITGTFSQGANDHEAVFTPAQPFAGGTSVKIMIHGEYQSRDGAQLGADYSFGFTTQTPDNTVLFSRSGYYDTLGSVKVGDAQTYTIYAGDQVKNGNTITIYKSTTDQLLQALVYTKTPHDGYTSSDFVSHGVDTTGLTAVLTKINMADGGTFNFTPSQGTYVLVATNQGKQVGSAWLVASNLGLIIRQDDQQAVVSVEDLTTGSASTADVTLYNLQDSVQTLKEFAATDITSVQLPYTPSLDLAVATHNGDTSVVPVAEPLTLADIRVQKDLSTSTVLYGLTDRPTYAIGDTVRYAGFLRTDNDANYQLPTSKSIHLYVASDPQGTHYADSEALVMPGGSLNATFAVSSDAIAQGQTSQQLYVYNGSADSPVDATTPVGAFTLTSNKPTNYRLSVQFSKTDYISSDNIAATITGYGSDGSALAGQTVSATIYARTFYENNPAGNLISFGTLGQQITDNPITVKLNNNGQATVPIDVSKFPAGYSQVATVQATFNDPTGASVAGGASAVVHQANGVLTFGPSRSVITSGGHIVGRLYARSLSNQPLANTTISYTLGKVDNDGTHTITTGNVTTNSTGYAEIDEIIGSYPDNTTLVLTATAADASDSAITASKYFYTANTSGSTVFSDVALSDLDIYGASTDATIGTTLNLTIDSPKSVHALVTLERGRIHSYNALDLKAGKNNYALPVTDDLAPSFNLIFSYFEDGEYHTEGVDFTVKPSSKQANLAIVTPATMQANQTITATATLHGVDGAPLSAPVVFGVVSANVYDLNNQVVPNIFDYLYSPREITTNASSSLIGIGSGGGKCGGGGLDQSALLNPLGTTADWQPGLATDSSGNLSTSFSLPKGSWRIYAYTMSIAGAVASTSTVVTVQ